MGIRLFFLILSPNFCYSSKIMSQHFSHMNIGTCSSHVDFDVEGGRIMNVHFLGGCSGNLQAIAHLLEGMELGEAARRLSGIRCGDKDTSCADQLARACIGAMGRIGPGGH